MTKIDKQIAKFLANPNSIHFSQIEKILIHVGFIRVQAKGSHVKFKHAKLEADLIIPIHNNDCKNFYKNLSAETIKKHHLN
jgi:predicted RNA binding protein YcfA (HicA-like mRNA interferase family)